MTPDEAVIDALSTACFAGALAFISLLPFVVWPYLARRRGAR